VISHEVKFIIVSNGNATPTWQLIRIAANAAALTNAAPAFLDTGRTRTHDLIVTLGPTDKTGDVPTTRGQDVHNTRAVAAAVATAVRPR
jgi:hypothetical protein